MNNYHDDIDTLLARRKERAERVVFQRGADEFTTAFFAAARRRHRSIICFRAIAATAALFLLAAGIFFAAGGTPSKPSQTVATDKLSETLRLFGPDTAVLFLNDSLQTGERLADAEPRNRVELTLHENGKPISLAFAGADEDTLELNTPEYSGFILISRSDPETLVVDVELTERKTGTQIRNIVPVRVPQSHHT